VILFIPFYLFYQHAKKNAEKIKKTFWKGRIVNKKHSEYEDDESNYTQDIYTLFFITDEKKEIKMNVTKKMFNEWQVGDMVEKKAGERWPTKI